MYNIWVVTFLMGGGMKYQQISEELERRFTICRSAQALTRLYAELSDARYIRRFCLILSY